MAHEEVRTIMVRDKTKIQDEAIANAEIIPGMLIELMSTAKVKAHANAGYNQDCIFAIENELEGQGIDDAYAATDMVQYRQFRAGDIVNCILKNGETITIGERVESAGDGTVQAHVDDVESFESAEAGAITVRPNQIIGTAIEALDLSGSSGNESSGLYASAYPRIQIRIT